VPKESSTKKEWAEKEGAPVPENAEKASLQQQESEAGDQINSKSQLHALHFKPLRSQGGSKDTMSPILMQR
jgi:hypothetical protein